MNYIYMIIYINLFATSIVAWNNKQDMYDVDWNKCYYFTVMCMNINYIYIYDI